MDPFSVSTMLNALPQREPLGDRETPAIPPPPHPRGISAAIPPSGFTTPLIHSCPCGCTASNPRELVSNLMTSSEESFSLSKETISKLNRRELASLLTSDSDYFMDIARNEHGSKRIQELLEKSDDVDSLFCAAIRRCFFPVMTDKHASYLAVHAIRVFEGEKKESMTNAAVALNEFITDLDHPYYRNKLLYIVACNALWLSNDAYGNFVIQQVLRLNDLRSTYHIAVKLPGHCVDLSFRRHGSYIVESLLEAEETVMMPVVVELLDCEGERLMRLARSVFGNFVVAKALRVTQEKSRADLF
ncbi:unnamed protein product [Arabis nemorensis]|uniref:PUM-HD domain-containing protein n=1 Tax=Arabis nemorensis TaxID=586526 RepID=A0A565CDJ0_9BRAS|nr:unnamed protein product [Arabis nemorensis]